MVVLKRNLQSLEFGTQPHAAMVTKGGSVRAVRAPSAAGSVDAAAAAARLPGLPTRAGPNVFSFLSLSLLLKKQINIQINHTKNRVCSI